MRKKNKKNYISLSLSLSIRLCDFAELETLALVGCLFIQSSHREHGKKNEGKSFMQIKILSGMFVNFLC
jgi:hypothetical protein